MRVKHHSSTSHNSYNTSMDGLHFGYKSLNLGKLLYFLKPEWSRHLAKNKCPIRFTSISGEIPNLRFCLVARWNVPINLHWFKKLYLQKSLKKNCHKNCIKSWFHQNGSNLRTPWHIKPINHELFKLSYCWWLKSCTTEAVRKPYCQTGISPTNLNGINWWFFFPDFSETIKQ